MTVGNPDLETTVETMLAPSQQHLVALGPALKGAGEDASTAYRDLVKTTSNLAGIGRSVAAEVHRLRADTSLPQDHRYREATEKLGAARIIITKLNQGANDAATRLEEALRDGVLPKAHRDPQQRALVRDELRTRYQSLRSVELTQAVIASLGSDPARDAELLSSFGESLMAGADAGDTFPAVRAEAVAKYLQRSDGTDRQVAARRALQEFSGRNIRGRISAFHQASRMFLADQ